ncbi:hypothetical protein [Paraburkholderia sp. RL17-337-BIB-A]|uniref:hypothetical protein n=1 Tax=Paraburkholderia sp. RL17-337-BIB-A TaxID=3031636 RepID=UPI0038BA54CC
MRFKSMPRVSGPIRIMTRDTGKVKGVIALTSRAQQMSAEVAVTTHLPALLKAQSLVRGLI